MYQTHPELHLQVVVMSLSLLCYEMAILSIPEMANLLNLYQAVQTPQFWLAENLHGNWIWLRMSTFFADEVACGEGPNKIKMS